MSTKMQYVFLAVTLALLITDSIEQCCDVKTDKDDWPLPPGDTKKAQDTNHAPPTRGDDRGSRPNRFRPPYAPDSDSPFPSDIKTQRDRNGRDGERGPLSRQQRVPPHVPDVDHSENDRVPRDIDNWPSPLKPQHDTNGPSRPDGKREPTPNRRHRPPYVPDLDSSDNSRDTDQYPYPDTYPGFGNGYPGFGNGYPGFGNGYPGFGYNRNRNDDEPRSPSGKRTTCIGLDGGDRCRRKCQKLKDTRTDKCYCSGSCEWSNLVLTCQCRDPTCSC